MNEINFHSFTAPVSLWWVVFTVSGVGCATLVAANCIDVLQAGAVGKLDQLP